MNICVLELIRYEANSYWENVENFILHKQGAGIVPQAISFWLRKEGHNVIYKSYYGVGDPLPNSNIKFDICFISAHTHLAPLAYALSKILKYQGTYTIIGGPHAKSFPLDSARYFDLVIQNCDKELILAVIKDRFPSGTIVTTNRELPNYPSISERLPEIKSTYFLKGKPNPTSIIPILSSTGCPNRCYFCTDYNTPYRSFDREIIVKDLLYIANNYPGTPLGFYDPNFAINFEVMMNILEILPQQLRPPYMIQSSLSNLTLDRLKRLQQTNCQHIAPGIESWTNTFSFKSGHTGMSGSEKLKHILLHFHDINEFIPFLIANFIIGLDDDKGDDPFLLTKEFILKTPYAWPAINTPIAFGGTILLSSLVDSCRILKKLPFSFYGSPYLSIILKNYNTIEYFSKLADLYKTTISFKLFKERIKTSKNNIIRFRHFYLFNAYRNRYRKICRLLRELKRNKKLRHFHDKPDRELPNFYHRDYKIKLGRYHSLMKISESSPILDQTTDPLVI